MECYENPIQHACDISIGKTFISTDGKRPEGLCESAWESMRPFVEATLDPKYDRGTRIRKSYRQRPSPLKKSLPLLSTRMKAGKSTGYVKAYVGGPNFRFFKYDMVSTGFPSSGRYSRIQAVVSGCR